ncbi:hypothetical protein LIA77_10541 [Sarocladium implicatum]|nr:hypothetical protein LIA77_10541 [Sarocladium implicatum]
MDEDATWRPNACKSKKPRRWAIRKSHKWRTTDVDPAKQGPPLPAKAALKAAITDDIEIDKSAVRHDVYRPIEWQDNAERRGTRPDLTKFLRSRAASPAQSAIDQLWIEGWETEAKFWPEEQANAYCNFALRLFSPKVLQCVTTNFHWYRDEQFYTASCVFFVHGWFLIKCDGPEAFNRKFWIPVWHKMYNAMALPTAKDPRWKAAVALSFKQPLHQPVSKPEPTNMPPVHQDTVSRGPKLPDRPTTQESSLTGTETVAASISDFTDEDWAAMSNAAYSIIRTSKTLAEASGRLSEAQYKQAIEQKKAEIEQKMIELKNLERQLYANGDADVARRFVALVGQVRSGDEVDDVEFSNCFAFVKELDDDAHMKSVSWN